MFERVHIYLLNYILNRHRRDGNSNVIYRPKYKEHVKEDLGKYVEKKYEIRHQMNHQTFVTNLDDEDN